MKRERYVAVFLLLAALSLLTVGATQRTQVQGGGDGATPKRKIACKVPENATSCYWTHGRLSYANGNPSFRIWKIGTDRVLGVFSGPSHFDDEDTEFPLELSKAYEIDTRQHKKATGTIRDFPPDIFGDFEVCPLKPEKEGHMQPVCIESAKGIFVKKD